MQKKSLPDELLVKTQVFSGVLKEDGTVDDTQVKWVTKHCSTCINHYIGSVFCGYSASECKIHGCLEALDNPHRDHDGWKCKDYQQKEAVG